MPLIRKFAIQGHDVPKSSYRAHGPFPPEIFRTNPRAEVGTEHSDSLHESLDDIRMFRCKDCGDIVYEDELDLHECEEEDYL